MKSNTSHNPVIAVPCTSTNDVKEQKVIALVQAEEYLNCNGCYYNVDNDCNASYSIICTDHTIYKEIPISVEQEKEPSPYIPTAKTLENPTYDSVEKPKHYMLFPEKDIEVRDLMKVLADQLDEQGYSGMVVSDYIQMLQYLLRWHNKNGLEDLEKAQWYLSKIIEQVKGN